LSSVFRRTATKPAIVTKEKTMCERKDITVKKRFASLIVRMLTVAVLAQAVFSTSGMAQQNSALEFYDIFVKSNSGDEVQVTMVITQEDGRTAFAQNWFLIDHTNFRLVATSPIPVRFSDRATTSGPPFSGQPDFFTAEITGPGAGVILAIINSITWGFSYGVYADWPMGGSQPFYGLMYEGWSTQTIGQGTGQTKHIFSFNAIRKRGGGGEGR
jgi:hypothetical protein